jgi:NitT/TauT family transport system permease protein
MTTIGHREKTAHRSEDPYAGKDTPRRRREVPLWIWQVGFGLVMLGLWELLSERVLDPFFFSSPSRVAVYVVEYAGSGDLLGDIGFSFRAAVTGYVIGVSLGVLSGFALAATQKISAVLNPYILAIYGIPRIALAPLFIVWFGIGIQSKIFMAALMAFFLAFFNTFTGVRQVDHNLVNIARVAGASRLDINRKVVLPAASPWIIAGLRISIPYAIVAALVAEFIASTQGLGYRIALNSQQFNTTGTMGGVIIVMALVLIANLLLDHSENHILRWQPNRAHDQGGM